MEADELWELEIDKIITHGNVVAVNGSMGLSIEAGRFPAVSFPKWVHRSGI